MLASSCPVQWAGRQAVVTLPEHMDVSNAGQIREDLLSVINRGATSLVADMTATVSCDHAGTDAVVRAYQRAAVNGAELRLVVTAQIVSRVLSSVGVDRLVSIYPSLEAATAASGPATPAAGSAGTRPPDVVPLNGGRTSRPAGATGAADGNLAAITLTIMRELVDALQDGVALVDGQGVLTLGSRRLADMFGYDDAELIGHPVESLIPAGLQAAYAQAPVAGVRLAGLRKDGTTFPAEISLSSLATPAGRFTLGVIRDVSQTPQPGTQADQARVATSAEHGRLGRDLPDRVVTNLFRVGLSLQAGIDLPAELTRQHIAEALGYLDEIISDVRRAAFTTGGHEASPHPALFKDAG
jgi:anti-anti-sigma factor